MTFFIALIGLIVGYVLASVLIEVPAALRRVHYRSLEQRHQMGIKDFGPWH